MTGQSLWLHGFPANELQIQILLAATRPMMLQSASGNWRVDLQTASKLLETEAMLCDGACVLSDNCWSNDIQIII